MLNNSLLTTIYPQNTRERNRVKQTSNAMFGQLDASRAERLEHVLAISRSVSSVTQEQDDISNFVNNGQIVAA